MISQLVFQQVSVMLVFILMGFVLIKKNMISKQGSKEMTLILLYLVTPAVQINAFNVVSSPERTRVLGLSLIYGLIAFFLGLAISIIFFKKDSLIQFGVTFCNAGFIGIPLIYSTLGQEAVFFALPYLTLQIIGMWTLGVYMITKDAHHISLKKIVSNPAVIFVVIGLIMYFGQLRLPSLGQKMVDMLVPLNSPLAMIVVGSLVAEANFKTLFKDLHLFFAAFLRLILSPLLVALIFVFLPGTSDAEFLMKSAVLIVAAAPTAANMAIFANLFDLNADQGVKLVSLTTILSILTIPFIVFVFESLAKL
jgi:malate permease and related proteins